MALSVTVRACIHACINPETKKVEWVIFGAQGNSDEENYSKPISDEWEETVTSDHVAFVEFTIDIEGPAIATVSLSPQPPASDHQP